MKRMIFFFLAAIMLLSFSGCDREPEIPTVSAEFTETTVSATEETTMPTTSEGDFSFSQLRYWGFRFASGAGGWGTNLQIAADGSFSGDYHDSEMGVVAEEYPNGSIYLSVFTGQFGQPEKLDAYTYSLKLEFMDYEIQPETTQIRDGVQYCYSEAFGLSGVQELLLYLPGTPIADLPEDFLIWANLYGSEASELPFYGLYDPVNATGFYSFHIIDEVRAYIQGVEAADLALNEQLTNTPTQTDMNIAADQRYMLWDDALNELWAVLQKVLDEPAMAQLTAEELQWIREKEQAAEDAAAEVLGGSLYPTVYWGTAAKLTQERVYELLAYLPQT